MLFIGEKIGMVDPKRRQWISLWILRNGVVHRCARASHAHRVGSPNTLLHAPDVYMDKVKVGPTGKGTVALDQSPEQRNVLHKRLGTFGINRSDSEQAA